MAKVEAKLKPRYGNKSSSLKTFELESAEVDAHKKNFPNMYTYVDIKPPKPTKKMKTEPDKAE